MIGRKGSRELFYNADGTRTSVVNIGNIYMRITL